jgi:metal-dependent amidase/aminoacylase/carboxypeptidase family protein
MQKLIEVVTTKVNSLAQRDGLSVNIDWADVFNASVNDPECAQRVADAAQDCGNNVVWIEDPLRWSEDFGALSQTAKGAMFALGAGQQTPQIHNPDYDFPDQLLTQGRDIFFKIYAGLLL